MAAKGENLALEAGSRPAQVDPAPSPQPPAPSHLFSIILPLSTHNYLFFYNIPALPPSFPQWSFAFNKIPALFVHFFELLRFPSSGRRDIESTRSKNVRCLVCTA
jgi:hypothetical protein